MIETIKNFIDGIIEKLNIQCEAVVTETDEEYHVELTGPEASVLIGYRGDVLDSLQYLTLLLINKDKNEEKRLVIDGENYRQKREETLSKLAKKLAFKVAKSGQPAKLEPMNPFERRIIHSALADDKYVTTESEGVEPNRCIVIKPNRVRNNDRRQSKPQQKQTVAPQATTPRNINKYGIGKMKSFGGPKRSFF